MTKGAFSFTEKGLNEALNTLGSKRVLIDLRTSVRSTAVRYLNLHESDQARLQRMTDAQLNEMVAELIKALATGRSLRIKLHRGRSRPKSDNADMTSIKCTITIEFED